MKNNTKIKDSWQELLYKPYKEVITNENLKFTFKRVFPNIKSVLKGEKSTTSEFLRPLAYGLDFFYFLICGFNWKKTKTFHKENIIFKKMERINRKFQNNFLSRYKENSEVLNLKGIRMPIIDNEDLERSVPDEIFKIWLNYKDNYSYKNVNKLDDSIGEDPYCYVGPNGEDITIKPGMNVIDAGAWIGDFSAYAAKKGARVYAFEPSSNTIKWLKKTAKLNRGIIPLQLGIGEKETTLSFEDEGDSAGNKISKEGKNKIRVIQLDRWVKNKKIKVDFIKSDIEGFERNMLIGAREILKRDAPILSLCTYHLPDDPEIMKKIILKANPHYRIIQRYRKMFAYVPKEKK